MAAITHFPASATAPKFQPGQQVDYYFTFANGAKPVQVEILRSEWNTNVQTNLYYHSGSDAPAWEYQLLPVGTKLAP